jgi:large subunit ribosomal protein L20
VKGFFIGRRRLRQANEAAMKADRFMFIGRKQRKRHFRRLWTQRINAAARLNGLSYSRLIHGLSKAGVTINRKMLADLAVREPATFTAIVDQAKAALG